MWPFVNLEAWGADCVVPGSLDPHPRGLFSGYVKVLALSTVLATVAASASSALAGGLTLPIRGVRSLARGGALIAGAAEPDSLWLNPAGLARASGNGTRVLLFDAAYLYQTVEHTRLAADGTPLPHVTNLQPGTALPTLAASLGIGDRLVLAGGIASPYTTFHRYAEDGPQRFASINLTGSTFVVVAVGVGYEVTEQLRVGVTLTNTFSKLSSELAVSGCPGAMTCDPADASYDARIAIEQTDYVAPSGVIGIQYDAGAFTLGAMFQAPTRVAGKGAFTIDLPSANVFDSATVVGDEGSLRFTLPPAIRAGIEVHVQGGLFVEAALGVELWSLHDEVEIAPSDVRIETIAGGPYTLGTMVIPRDYETSYAASLGLSWQVASANLMAGYAYETAAAPPSTVSVLAVDGAKHLLGLGGEYDAEGWRIGAAVGVAFLSDVDVPLADARVPQLAPLRDEPLATGINAGSYASRYIVAGLRFARRF